MLGDWIGGGDQTTGRALQFWKEVQLASSDVHFIKTWRRDFPGTMGPVRGLLQGP